MTGELTWKAEDIIHAVHGHCLHEQSWIARGVSVDSRLTRPGDLFIALKGREHDGHDYVAAAFEAGAIAAIISRQVHVSSHAPLILVPDTLKALEDIGRAGRNRSPARIVAVGGANKSECSDMLYLMLNEVGETCTGGNNAEDLIDIPLSLARLPASATYGVFGIGMNKGNEIEHLSRQLGAAITLIATPMHPDYFPFMETIGDGKAHIFAGMPPHGVVILDRDNPEFLRLAAAAKAQGLKKIVGYGRDGKSDARLLDYIETPEGSEITADIFGRKMHYSLGVQGMQAALNSIAALYAALAAGADAQICAAALAHYRSSKSHSVVQNILLPDGAFTLITEGGDTSPAGLRFSIRLLGQMMPGLGGQRILVLGDIEPYPGLTQDIAKAGITCVFCHGVSLTEFYKSLPKTSQGFHAENGNDLAPHIAKTVEAGDIVAVKGPPDARLETVVDALRAFGDDRLRIKKRAG